MSFEFNSFKQLQEKLTLAQRLLSKKVKFASEVLCQLEKAEKEDRQYVLTCHTSSDVDYAGGWTTKGAEP